MKMRSVLPILLLCIFSVVIFSCSDDDKSESCRATEISMKVNGELRKYVVAGWEINMTPDSDGGFHQQLGLQFYRDLNGTFSEEYLTLSMRYKRTGHNKIETMTLSRFDDEHTGEYSIVNDDFHDNVRVNRSTCFYATFSGKFIADGEEIVITEGEISEEYEEPFDE